MHLREKEQILKIFRHHPTPFSYTLLGIIFGSIPFFLIVFFISSGLSKTATIFANGMVVTLFLLVVAHAGLIFWLDRLVVTNQRVIYINWVTLFNRDENEAELNDIQEIATKEKGIFSALSIFDYGIFRLETAATRTTILFENAPDPEGIRQFIYEIKGQHTHHNNEL